MNKLRVYAETSVVGGAFDEAFDTLSKPFWNAVLRGGVVLMVSDLLKDELSGAPKQVRDLFDQIPETQIEQITTTEQAKELAMRYIAEKVVGKSSFSDCLHIALATLHHADVLVSWNFKHIVNRTRINGYNSVNMKLGYSQYEVINDEK